MFRRTRSFQDDSKPAHPVLMYGCLVVVVGILLVAGAVGTFVLMQTNNVLRVVATR